MNHLVGCAAATAAAEAAAVEVAADADGWLAIAVSRAPSAPLSE